MMKRVFQALVCRLLFKHHINQFNGSLISCPAEALKAVVEAAKTGVSVLSLCEKGDAFIVAETGKIFKREKEMKKGIFFSFSCSFFLLGFSLFANLTQHSLIHSLSFPGIAFPTCVSVNNCVCHFSPLKSDPEVILKDGDLVKM